MKQPLHILYVIPDYSFTTIRALKHFVAIGHKVTIVSPYKLPGLLKFIPTQLVPKTVLKKLLLQKQIPTNSNVSFITESFLIVCLRIVLAKFQNEHTSNTLKTILESKLLNKVNFRNIDVIYCFDTAAAWYQFKGKEYKVPNILEYRGSQIDFAIESFALASKNLNNFTKPSYPAEWLSKLRREVSELANHVVGYSEFHKKQFTKVLPDPNNFHIIPIASDFLKSEKVVQSPKNGGSIKFIFIGTVSIRKGVHFLIKAWQELNREESFQKNKLTIIGDNLNEFPINSDADNIIVLPRLHQKEVQKHLLKSHVFVFPSTNDSFAMIVNEAIQMNIPIIGTKNCGAVEMIEHGKHGYVYNDPFDVEQLKEALLFFNSHPEKIEMYSNSLSQLGNPWSYQQERDAFIQLLKSLH